MKMLKRNYDEAVSPVVGVMLMLVVTIVIAAVVSGFAGGLMGSADKAPSITMDIAIKNTGHYATSTFEAKVNSVSEGIQTGDLKLITSWTNSTGCKGGATVTATTNVFGWTGGGAPAGGNYTAPWGYGPGVVASNSGKPNDEEQQFGNYTLLGGTSMYALPAGQTGGYINPTTGSGYGTVNQFKYNTSAWQYEAGVKVDGMQAILGENWESLRTGDIVNVRIIYLPTGVTIYKNDVVVS